MQIAIPALLTKRIEPNPLGGTEAITYSLIEGLVKKGHEVTVYCAKGSKTSAQHQVELCEADEAMQEISNLHFVYPYTLLEVQKLVEDIPRNKFDLIHVNFLKIFFMSAVADSINIPILYTIHRDFFQHTPIVSLHQKIGIHSHEYFAFVSKAAQNASLIKDKTSTVYNGIEVDQFPFSEYTTQKNFLWISRIDPLKGPLDAIKASILAHTPLHLSGIIDRPFYQEYFDKNIKPLLNDMITYEDHSTIEHKLELYQQSKALLFPIQWEEPFGLVVVEAMACGTPVIAYARGAMPELIQDGITGFLVNPSETKKTGNWIIKESGIEGLTKAMEKLNSLSDTDYITMRKASRVRVEQNFTTEQMVNAYIQLYTELINKHKQ